MRNNLPVVTPLRPALIAAVLLVLSLRLPVRQ